MVETQKATTWIGIAVALALIGAGALAGAWLIGPASGTRGNDVAASLNLPTRAPDAAGMRGFEDVVERVKPAVFGVRARVLAAEPSEDQNFLPSLGEQPNATEEEKVPHPTTNQGSGFFISADGYAITANHVVARGSSIEIDTHEGETYPATLVGSDPESDIALLKVDGGGDFRFVEFADDVPKIGEWVITVGNPFGLGGTVTAGIVSAQTRNIEAGYSDFIQIDAPVNQGNSGGPTFNSAGRVIGVNSAIVSPTGGSVGIGFAIPAEIVQAVASELKEKGVVVRAWIGLRMQPITPEIAEGLSLKDTKGALIAEALPDGPADQVGIQSGDIIASLNGAPLENDSDLARKIRDMPPGTRVELGVIRQGKQSHVALTLSRLSSPPSEVVDQEPVAGEGSTDPSTLGLELMPGKNLAPGFAGVIVAKVDPDGLAAERGFQPGDVILEVAGNAVTKPSDVKEALDEARSKSKRNAIARVKTGDATRFLAIPVG